MAGFERVTVTLPNNLVRDIDRQEKNRSKFVAEALVDGSVGKPVRWVPGEGWVEERE